MTLNLTGKHLEPNMRCPALTPRVPPRPPCSNCLTVDRQHANIQSHRRLFPYPPVRDWLAPPALKTHTVEHP
jgi:hypothetical protein